MCFQNGENESPSQLKDEACEMENNSNEPWLKGRKDISLLVESTMKDVTVSEVGCSATSKAKSWH